MRRVKSLLLMVGSCLLIDCGGGGTTTTPTTNVTAPASVSFGQVSNGSTSAPMTVVITNSGTTTASFSSGGAVAGADAGDFNITTSTCTTGTSLASHQSCSVSITFTPTGSSSESASLTFSISGSSAQSVALTGNGGVSATNVTQGQVRAGAAGNINALYIAVTICVPGTSTCQIIPSVEVDTGSSGLRILSSSLNLTLPQSMVGSNKLGNCVQFADLSYAFGPVKRADIYLAGEVALNQPIQVIADPNFASAPTGSFGCVVSGGSNIQNAANLGGNGLIGIGLFKQDCGPACSTTPVPGAYYSCNGNNCTTTTVSIPNQLQNPVSQFSQDNNGVIISMPSIPSAGTSSVTGSIIYGIDTKSNNTLGSAKIYLANGVGNMSTVYNNSTYSSFIDSGSNGLFFLNSSGSGMANCSSYPGFYCPPSATTFNVANIASDSSHVATSFTIGNAADLFNSNSSYAAYNDIGGPFPNSFDFGMPYFYGRRILFGFEGEAIGSNVGPLYAY